MADAHALDDLPAQVEDHEALVAAGSEGTRLGFRLAAEIADKYRIGVVVEFFVVAPQLASVVVPKGIAEHELIASVAIDVVGIGKVPGLPLPLPEQIEIVVVDPEIAIAIFDQDFPAFLVA